MNNLDLKFRIDYHLNNSPKDVEFTDLIGSPAGADYDALLATAPNGETHADILGITQMSSPAGVFYTNNYTANIFTSPDTDGSINDWAKAAIPLPLSGGAVICGTYNFQYKVRLNLLGLFKGKAGGFTISGDYTALLGAAPTGLKVQVYGGTHSGVYDITTITYGVPDTTINVSQIVAPFVADVGESIAIIFETSRPFVFCPTTRTTDIDVSDSCIYSNLTATDNSNYDMTFAGVNVTPTVTRAWSIAVPVGMSAVPATGSSNPFQIGYGTTIFGGANLWTGNYNVSLTSSLLYVMSSPSLLWDTYVWIRVYDTVALTTAHVVACETCFCDMMPCVKNLFDRYAALAETNPSEASKLLKKIVIVLDNWMLYQMAERCGGDISTYCANITAIIQQENCNCPTPDTIVSQEVIPLALQVAGSGCCGVGFGDGALGLPAAPSVGDIYYITSTGGGYNQGDIYGYTLGGWVLQYNNMGATGAAGAAGANGANGADGVAVVFDKTFTSNPQITNNGYIPFAALNYTCTDLVNKGDKVLVKAAFGTEGIYGGKVKITVDGNDIALPIFLPLFAEHTFVGDNWNVFVECELTLQAMGTNTLYCLYHFYITDSLLNNISSGSFSTTFNVANYASFAIEAEGTSDGVHYVDCSQLAVISYKI